MEHVICDIRLGFISVCDKGHLRKKQKFSKDRTSMGWALLNAITSARE